MPRGPKGQKRPADAVGAAVMVAKIATGEIVEPAKKKSKKFLAAAEIGRLGGKARAKKLSKKRRTEIARAAAAKRWGKSD